MSCKSNHAYLQERLQDLDREKDCLQLQVTVLEDQIEGQADKINQLGKLDKEFLAISVKKWMDWYSREEQAVFYNIYVGS